MNLKNRARRVLTLGISMLFILQTPTGVLAAGSDHDKWLVDDPSLRKETMETIDEEASGESAGEDPEILEAEDIEASLYPAYMDPYYGYDRFSATSNAAPNYTTPVKTQAELKERLNALINKYANRRWTTTGEKCVNNSESCETQCYYGYLCYGFAKYIFNDLFCSGDIGDRTRATINVKNNCAVMVAQNLNIGEGDVDAVRRLFSYALPGDYVQIRQRNEDGLHSIIVGEVTEEGIMQFHSNYDSHCMCRYNLITWDEFSWVNDGASIYRAVNYPSNSRTKYTDVRRDSYYEAAVIWADKNGITTGTTPITFSPMESCTRAQLVTFLWRANGSPEPKSATCKFTDVDKNRYFYKAILWAAEEGITTGTNPTTFSPDDTATRGQFVTFLHRSKGNPSCLEKVPFTDVDSRRYYASPISWAYTNGITTGTSPSTFGPDEPCTRAQVVTFIYRAMK